MQSLLRLSRGIDMLTEWVGKTVYWLILVAVGISALNAIVRKAFNVGSNAFLEIQWYLFSAVFLLAAGYTLLRNEHVRVDVFSSRLSVKGRMWIDVIGLTIFLIPIGLLMIYLSWPQFVNAWVSGEMSSNAGGLIRWPVLLLLPLGYVLLITQGVSELIKRIACIRGLIDDPTLKQQRKTPEEELAETIRLAAEKAEKAAAKAEAALHPAAARPH